MESIESSYSRPFGMAAVRPDVPRFTTENVEQTTPAHNNPPRRTCMLQTYDG